MSQAFFNGLSGLLTFTKGLQIVSNNVANMNTPGFRGSETFYRSVSGDGTDGVGAEITGTAIRDETGQLSQTNNNTDVAINGTGYFVLKASDGSLYYTRAGQLELDADKNLIDSVTKYDVQGIGSNGQLAGINIASDAVLAAVPTTKVNFTGILLSSSPSDTVSNVAIFDSLGATNNLTITLTSNAATTPNSWTVSVSDSSGATVGTGTIEFSADGTPLTGFNTFNITLTKGTSQQVIAMNFGDPGSDTGATQQASGTSSTLAATAADGSASSGMQSFSFDSKGVINFTYANGKTTTGGQLALASFADDNALQYVKDALYKNPDDMKPAYGTAGSGVYGEIQGGYIELSNVNLAQEFGDILIIQQGYQASSRIMTVSNEMIQQLYGGSQQSGS